jgi:hypothetical protein
MTVAARPVPPPAPPVRETPYTDEVLARAALALTEYSWEPGGDFAKAFDEHIAALTRQGLLLIDTTRSAASVDLKVYSAKVEELGYWRERAGTGETFIGFLYGGRMMEAGDL